MSSPQTLVSESMHHTRWVKVSHWIITLSFLALTFSGYVILMCHPRLYWGETGNDLTPAVLEFPISRNLNHGGWAKREAFFEIADSPVSAGRTYEIFNQNGWGRSLHFLSAWFLVVTGLVYLVSGVFTKHFRKNLVPHSGEFKWRLFWSDAKSHLRKRMSFENQSGYGLLQKCSYLVVIFFVLPVIVLTGMTMSPAITAGYPFLLKIFGGGQSARTIHFFASFTLVLFLLVHIVMIVRSGFKRQMKAMTFGK